MVSERFPYQNCLLLKSFNPNFVQLPYCLHHISFNFMSIVNHKLGEYEHIYRHSLKLTTKGDITLSYPNTAQSSIAAPAASIEELLSSRAWITAGTNFKINFVISFHGVVVGDGSISEHSENLGSVLRDGQVPLPPHILRLLAKCPR